MPWGDQSAGCSFAFAQGLHVVSSLLIEHLLCVKLSAWGEATNMDEAQASLSTTLPTSWRRRTGKREFPVAIAANHHALGGFEQHEFIASLPLSEVRSPRWVGRAVLLSRDSKGKSLLLLEAARTPWLVAHPSSLQPLLPGAPLLTLLPPSYMDNYNSIRSTWIIPLKVFTSATSAKSLCPCKTT